MKTMVCQSEIVKMAALNNLFIEMTAKFCNQKCASCYIDFPQYKKVKDFIDIDIVKAALDDTKREDIKCIYLTGAEPMTHPNFNAILRLCLKRANVCICTNGSFINEKKARFLKKVADETPFEIIFKISFNHYEEDKNDISRCRGAFRQAIFGLKHLLKYDFMPIVVCTNFYNESYDSLFTNFRFLMQKIGMNLDRAHFHVIPFHDKNSVYDENFVHEHSSTDCSCGRILTAQGVYSCPFLASDYRGWCGSSFKDYTKRCSLETSFCQTCLKSKKHLFGINFSEFK